MSESFMLCMFSLAMFFGSYLSGLVPLAFNLSETKMRYVTVLGAGLLVGTALAVIVPEGVHALYLNQLKPHEHPTVDSHVHKRHLNALQEPVKEEPGHLHEHESEPKLTKPDSDDHSDSTHSTIGVTLILGFVFMLIVDNCGSRIFHHHGNQVIDSAGSSVINKPKPTWTATLGLVVHAAADGIALGAASATSRFNVELIVFIAIMLHKAPAAFGLVSFLISDGVDRKRIRRHLIVFSLAAPLMALFTFVLLKSRIQEPYSMDSTGIAMLFSAGTFLFVATVHVLPEVQSHNEDRQFRIGELLILILGCTCPIILSMGHKH